MDLEPYIETIRHQLELTADAGGDEARALAARLVTQIEAVVRLAIQDALAAAAEEITLELAPGSVELRLRGREPEFVVTLPEGSPAQPVEDVPAGWRPRAADGDDAGVSRINLRLPDPLKAQVEQAAGTEGLSVNAWLVRAAAAAIGRTDAGRRRERGTQHGPQRYTGWAR